MSASIVVYACETSPKSRLVVRYLGDRMYSLATEWRRGETWSAGPSFRVPLAFLGDLEHVVLAAIRHARSEVL